MPKIHFCTFGSNPNYTESVKVLFDEAYKSGYFDSVICYDQYFVAETYPEHLPFFRQKFSRSELRGFGYWLWKPLVILARLQEIPVDDILFYADCGCSIETNETAQKHFQEWVSDIETHPTHRISFQMPHHEETYTKGSLLAYMNRTGDKTGQYLAGIQGLKHTLENISFLKKWIEIAGMNNYHFITDEQSFTPNADSFIDHRHDQSIYSLLVKEYGTAAHQDYWPDTNYPIIASRRRINLQPIDKDKAWIV